MSEMPELIQDVPNVSGNEEAVREAARNSDPAFRHASRFDFDSARSGFSVALHMHQPLVPAGGDDLRTADVISYLQYMAEHPDIGDNHNAPVFQWCYKRIGEFVPELVNEGHTPRVMLDYSGTLLYGLRKMGADDVIDALKRVTCEEQYRPCVEWLGCPWGHAVAPSTPVQDYRLHVQAWQHHFAAIFGLDALKRVRGFSPAEMALPNHPEVAYEFVKTLRDCGFRWVLVQEHSVEEPETGDHPRNPHVPHRMVVRNADGEEASIIAIVKTQGSDTKLVAQMQPFHEAKGQERAELGGVSIPRMVTQIGDGENGGVMMNEFPDMFRQTMREASGSDTPPMNVSEYLEHLDAAGVSEDQYPLCQPVFQKRIWERVQPGCGSEKLEEAIEELRNEDDRFHVEGGSWTNDRSWVQGYEDVIGPMKQASAHFAEKVLGNSEVDTSEHRYRNALYYLLISQTSCYRYWGEGAFTDYGKELCRRLEAILGHDF
jgi:hypothetical protein